jgi:hypothetical protein
MDELDFKNAWKMGDERQRDDALAVWTEHKILPVGDKPAKRLAELVSVAYSGREPVGVATAQISFYNPVRSKLAFLRCFVVPTHRQQDVARGIIRASYRYLSDWSEQHPEEEVRGAAVVAQSPFLGPINRKPVWSETKLSLIGYTDKGQQIRLSWFDHIWFPEEMA